MFPGVVKEYVSKDHKVSLARVNISDGMSKGGYPGGVTISIGGEYPRCNPMCRVLVVQRGTSRE